MKQVLSIMALSAFSLFANAQSTKWNLDKSHSRIGFGVEHMVISEVNGQFKNFSMDVKSDKADFSDAKVTITMDVNSINTDDEKRDGHLKSADFFNAEKNPNITFVSKSFKKVKGKLYKVTGELTMNGVTKTVTLDARFNGIIKSPYGDTRSGVMVYGEIDRFDFGLKYGQVMEAGGLAIGRKVRIACAIELIKG